MTRIEPGDRVTDGDESADGQGAMRVLRRTNDRADEHEIGALPGSPTVAAVNPNHPASDTVIVVAYESSLRRTVPDWRGVPIETLDARFDDADGTLYSFPESRLRPVSEDWEPAVDDGTTSGQRERDRVFGDHEDAVEAFIEETRRLLTEPDRAATDLLGAITVSPRATETVANAEAVLADMASPPYHEHTVTPLAAGVGDLTRGECRYTRDDKYRPENDDAIVCWECSDRPNQRPEKFTRDDDAGRACEQAGVSEWELREHVRESIDLSQLSPRIRAVYDDDRRGLLGDLAALQSGDDDQIRKTALRMAYRSHLEDVETYNYNRALALLRDHGAAADLPIIGDGDDETNSQVATPGGGE